MKPESEKQATAAAELHERATVVIENTLLRIVHALDKTSARPVALCILASLARAKPPILICTGDELRKEDWLCSRSARRDPIPRRN